MRRIPHDKVDHYAIGTLATLFFFSVYSAIVSRETAITLAVCTNIVISVGKELWDSRLGKQGAEGKFFDPVDIFAQFLGSLVVAGAVYA